MAALPPPPHIPIILSPRPMVIKGEMEISNPIAGWKFQGKEGGRARARARGEGERQAWDERGLWMESLGDEEGEGVGKEWVRKGSAWVCVRN